MFACIGLHATAGEPRCLPDDRIARTPRDSDGAPAGNEQDVAAARLLEIARGCSPRVECVDPRLVTVDASGLTRLFGGPRAFAEELRRQAAQAGLVVGVAIACTRTAAIALAATREGVTVALPGRAAAALAPLPLGVLAVLDEQFDRESVAARRRRSSPVRHYRAAPQPSQPAARDAPPSSGGHRLATSRGAAAPLDMPEAIATLERWGIHTLGALARLPRADLHERLGDTGLRWQRLARGDDLRPLVRSGEEIRFEQALSLEWPIEGLEPLSFVLARLFDGLESQLEHHDRGAVVLHVWLKLVTRAVHHRVLQLPAAIRDAKVLRTLVLLDLESHPPAAGIDEVRIAAEPAPARIVQFSLIDKPLPSADALSTLTARLTALMGEGRCGSPALLETHRPGAFRVTPFAPGAMGQRPAADAHADTVRTVPLTPASGWSGPRAVLRRFRRPIAARVTSSGGRPTRVTTSASAIAGGRVVQLSGPWLTSGDWWAVPPDLPAGPRTPDAAGRPTATHGPWSREEWDVALPDGAIYRLHHDCLTDRWLLEGYWD